MPEFRFHHLERRRLDQALPDLLDSALAEGLRAVVQARSPEEVEAINERLWTFSEESFLPHGSARDGDAEAKTIPTARACAYCSPALRPRRSRGASIRG